MAGSNPSNPVGRPTVMTDQVFKDLKSAFLIGANDKEAYGYAGISHETFYNYIEKHPEFREQITQWQDEPILKARRKVIDELDKDVKNAQWYLERKRKSEFGQKVEIEGGENPIRLLLDAYGLTDAYIKSEGENNATRDK